METTSVCINKSRSVIMKVYGPIHDQKDAYMIIFLPGCLCLCTSAVMFLLHLYLHSLNCVSFVISIFSFDSFHDAMLYYFPSVVILFITISKLTICGQHVKCCHPFSIKLHYNLSEVPHKHIFHVIVRRAGLLWSQQDFEWRWSVPLFKCLTVLEFSFILFDLCLLITFFNFIMNYVPIVTFWIFTYHKIWILSIMFCSIWSYWIIYFLACLEVSWRVVS